MPVWLCLTCEGLSYGWAHGVPCIYCGSSDVVGTEEAYFPDENTTGYGLVYYSRRQWEQLRAAATRAGQSIHAYLAAREHTDVVLVRDLPTDEAKLILYKLPLFTTSTTFTSQTLN